MEDEITTWLHRLQKEDSRAPGVIWNQYADKLARLAKGKLKGVALRVEDEEDIAVSAFDSIVRYVKKNPTEISSDDFWALLVTFAARKTSAKLRRHHAQKRGSGKNRGDSIFAGPDQPGFDATLGREPSPELAAQVAEEVEILLNMLSDSGDDVLRTVAILKLEGHTNKEIADKINRVERTVERKIDVIKRIWKDKWDAINS